MAITINDAPRLRRLRSGTAPGVGVDREAKIIRGFSVVTAGEALGHGLWLDSEFVQSVARAGNAARGGLKSRFTHPGLSGDGMGKQIGRAKNFRAEADRVLADLHLYQTANQDYVSAVLDLAEEDPKAFGTSIVFSEDPAAMREFQSANTGKDGAFRSPDKANKKNFPHARLASLDAVDAVDEPAANPGGLFSSAFAPGSELAARAEAVLAFALGLTDEQPDELAFGPHPERVRAFVQEFLERRGLMLVDTEQAAIVGSVRDFRAPEDDTVTPLINSFETRLTAAERIIRELQADFKLKEGF